LPLTLQHSEATQRPVWACVELFVRIDAIGRSELPLLLDVLSCSLEMFPTRYFLSWNESLLQNPILCSVGNDELY
jgi:hypothetical protein